MLSQGKASPDRPIQDDPRWLLAQRIASSLLFQRSPRLRAFLLYVAENALRHPGEPLTEHHIGCAVFERSQSYSPGEDNIVRVQARHLRTRLEEYFQNEGQAESLILEVPKGGYLPVFRSRDEIPPPLVFDPPTTPPARRSWLPLTLAILAALAVGWFLRGGADSVRNPHASPFLRTLFDNSQPVRLIAPDSSFGLLQGYLQRNLSLADYLSPGYPSGLIDAAPLSPELRARAKSVASRPYTTFSDLLIAARASALAERHNWNLTVSFPRDVTPREFETGNLILIGSPKSNPWTSLLEKQGHFESFYDLVHARGGIRNRNPNPGEAAEYLNEPRHGYSGAAYSLLAFHQLKGQKVLCLAGTNMEATEAAWEFISSPQRAQELLNRLSWRQTPSQDSHFEVILKTYVLAGSTRDTEIVTFRVETHENR